MKKILAIAAILLLTTAAAYFSSCNNQSGTTADDKTNDSLNKVIERGKYLATHVALCIECHSDHDMTKYSGPIIPGTEGGGGFVFDQKLGMPGVLYGRNITPDSATGIGTWTDDEILRAMTHGINKNGDTLFPLMPYHNYSRLAKDDLLAIIAYIKTLTPIERADVPKKLMITPSMFGPLPQNTLDQNKRPDPSDKVKYGEYLVTMASCGDCHTPMTQQGPDFSKMFAGGFHFKSDFVNVTTANITPDTATGIGSWTEEAFLAKFKANVEAAEKKVNPGKMNTEMPWAAYGKMKEEDLKAIYAFLRTVKPISNKVEKWPK